MWWKHYCYLYLYKHLCSFVSTCQATFTVVASPPVILTCPTNTTVASCQSQTAVNAAFTAWLATGTASGGCNRVLTNNNSGAPDACGGSTTVTFTYTSSWSFTFDHHLSGYLHGFGHLNPNPNIHKLQQYRKVLVAIPPVYLLVQVYQVADLEGAVTASNSY